MSFAVGGLLRNESLEAARLYQRVDEWTAVRDEILVSGLLPFRTRSSANRTVRELVDRLSALSDEEIGLLVDGTGQEQDLLLWLAICRTYRFIAEFAVEVMRERFLSFRTELTYDAFDAFFDRKAEWNAELTAISTSSRAKLRQVLFRMLREAGMLSPEGDIRRVLLTPRLDNLIASRNPDELRLFPGADERGARA